MEDFQQNKSLTKKGCPMRTTSLCCYLLFGTGFFLSPQNISSSAQALLSPSPSYENRTGGNSPDPQYFLHTPSLDLIQPMISRNFQFFINLLSKNSYAELQDHQSEEKEFPETESLLAYCYRHHYHETRLILSHFLEQRGIDAETLARHAQAIVQQEGLNTFQGFKRVIAQFLCAHQPRGSNS